MRFRVTADVTDPAAPPQCFGTYATRDEAVAAHDIAVLLIHGATGELNLPVTDYLDLSSNTLLPHVEVPPQVRDSVEAYFAARKGGGGGRGRGRRVPEVGDSGDGAGGEGGCLGGDVSRAASEAPA